MGAGFVDLDVQNARGALDDQQQFLRGVKLQPQGDAETVAQRRGELAGAGRGADKREMRQLQMQGVGGWTFAENNINGVVLHGRVQNFLVRPVQSVNFIHKQDVALAEIGKHGNKIAGFFYSRAGGYAHVHSHFICYYSCKRGFAKPRRAVKQNVIKRLAAHFCGVDENIQVIFCLFLANILTQGAGAQRRLPRILRQNRRGCNYVLIVVFRKADAHFPPSLTLSCVLVLPLLYFPRSYLLYPYPSARR